MIRAPTGLVFNFMSEVQTPNESHAHTQTLLPLIYSDSGPHLDASINSVRVYVCVCFFFYEVQWHEQVSASSSRALYLN